MQLLAFCVFDLLLKALVALGSQRETWQNVGALVQSKAEVASFCLELTKKLDMRYALPPMPVELSMSNKTGVDNESVAARFQAMAATAGDDVAALFSQRS